MLEQLPSIFKGWPLEGLLTELYRDLAQPGVRQVGKALETILQTGNCVFLPLRLLNEKSRLFEERKFSEIRDRLSKINLNDIVDVIPEIGHPILDALSITNDDQLRSMFIELLGKSADRNKVKIAHPSFVRVIESITPDEALLLKSWKGKSMIPYMSVSERGPDSSSHYRNEIVIEPVEGLLSYDMTPVYISNLVGLGILETRIDAWISDPEQYSLIIEMIISTYPNAKDGSLSFDLSPFKTLRDEEKISEGDTFYERRMISILPYGQAFQSACIAP